MALLTVFLGVGNGDSSDHESRPDSLNLTATYRRLPYITAAVLTSKQNLFKLTLRHRPRIHKGVPCACESAWSRLSI
jgi:hypothetical protein